MYYHLILTDDCNLCCTYCRGKAFTVDPPETSDIAVDEDLPVDLDIDLADLYRFLAKDPEAVLTFYGGEPLLAVDRVREIVRDAPVSALILHTNGTLLDRLDPDTANRFDTILVSIDGPEGLTDAHRGEGTFGRITRNLRGLAAGGFAGELIARMTVTEDTDIVEAVRYLTANDRFSFSAVHWQMDANFWNDYRMRDYAAWVEKSYNPGIRTLVEFWVETMRREGRVLRWYPFMDPMQDMLLGRPSMLRCGCGHANYSIMTDGHIAPCPIMVGMKDYYVGHIATADPLRLPVTAVGSPCTACGIRDFCGGRCLYSNITRPWPEEGRQIVCGTVENLYQALSAALPEIRRLIDAGKVRMEDFDHRKYNSCEIIP
ncbi:TIGR04084 family radical SAM/SPASM domain-containing protein [Methanoculleus sp. Wushi-C6]|uniref:TIGR04084 family radical SAM/SPASM domain-containing protein n=1 Tax=Methanoculleus caldifontis TaxID=2651577 RepID=A0ABU3WZU1_9EURY|nr:TIGR04084 family radical SAM/SPASM domain-containing protein [Methanoculleus sp. Wushi-C6]MDV2481317.1 TIGR04084 family radical SAM/SPASM domain-containing protein [Methanoculleus sp. Wushi-C6]